MALTGKYCELTKKSLKTSPKTRQNASNVTPTTNNQSKTRIHTAHVVQTSSTESIRQNSVLCVGPNQFIDISLISLIDDFDGKVDTELYFDRFEEISKLSGWTERLKTIVLIGKLKGRAKKFLNSDRILCETRDYEEIKKAFLNYFVGEFELNARQFQFNDIHNTRKQNYTPEYLKTQLNNYNSVYGVTEKEPEIFNEPEETNVYTKFEYRYHPYNRGSKQMIKRDNANEQLSDIVNFIKTNYKCDNSDKMLIKANDLISNGINKTNIEICNENKSATNKVDSCIAQPTENPQMGNTSVMKITSKDTTLYENTEDDYFMNLPSGLISTEKRTYECKDQNKSPEINSDKPQTSSSNIIPTEFTNAVLSNEPVGTEIIVEFKKHRNDCPEDNTSLEIDNLSNIIEIANKTHLNILEIQNNDNAGMVQEGTSLNSDNIISTDTNSVLPNESVRTGIKVKFDGNSINIADIPNKTHLNMPEIQNNGNGLLDTQISHARYADTVQKSKLLNVNPQKILGNITVGDSLQKANFKMRAIQNTQISGEIIKCLVKINNNKIAISGVHRGIDNCKACQFKRMTLNTYERKCGNCVIDIGIEKYVVGVTEKELTPNFKTRKRKIGNN